MPAFQPVTRSISRLELQWRLGPFRVPVAVWLIRAEGDFVLVDSGPPQAADEVVSAVAQATEGRGPRMLLLTHGQPDHAGGLEALRTAWNPPILCHKEEVPFVTGERTYRELEPRSVAFWFGRFLLGGGDWELPVARDLERGQPVVGMVVIHLPGPSPDHVGFLHPEEGAMICGDAVTNLRGDLVRSHPLTTVDPEASSTSVGRLAELDFDHLLPSHGIPIMGRGHTAVVRLLKADQEAEFAAD